MIFNETMFGTPRRRFDFTGWDRIKEKEYFFRGAVILSVTFQKEDELITLKYIMFPPNGDTKIVVFDDNEMGFIRKVMTNKKLEKLNVLKWEGF